MIYIKGHSYWLLGSRFAFPFLGMQQDSNRNMTSFARALNLPYPKIAQQSGRGRQAGFTSYIERKTTLSNLEYFGSCTAAKTRGLVETRIVTLQRDKMTKQIAVVVRQYNKENPTEALDVVKKDIPEPKEGPFRWCHFTKMRSALSRHALSFRTMKSFPRESADVPHVGQYDRSRTYI